MTEYQFAANRRIVALESDLARAERDVARLTAALVAVRDAKRTEWPNVAVVVFAVDVAMPIMSVQDLLPAPEGWHHPEDGDGHPAGWDGLEGDPEPLTLPEGVTAADFAAQVPEDSRPVCGCGSPDHERPNSRYQPERRFGGPSA